MCPFRNPLFFLLVVDSRWHCALSAPSHRELAKAPPALVLHSLGGSARRERRQAGLHRLLQSFREMGEKKNKSKRFHYFSFLFFLNREYYFGEKKLIDGRIDLQDDFQWDLLLTDLVFRCCPLKPSLPRRGCVSLRPDDRSGPPSPPCGPRTAILATGLDWLAEHRRRMKLEGSAELERMRLVQHGGPRSCRRTLWFLCSPVLAKALGHAEVF